MDTYKPQMNDKLSNECKAAFARIMEHRVDIAYRKDTLFAAYYRIKGKHEKALKYSEIRKIITMTLSIVLLSGIVGLIFGLDELAAKITITLFGVIAMILSIFQFKEKTPIDNSFEYLERAEALVSLHKHIKSEEALIESGAYGFNDHLKIISILKDIEARRNTLYQNPLPTEYEDYLSAKSGIEKGQQGYTKGDFENT